MKNLHKLIKFGFVIGLALWTFVMGAFYGLINFGGDFIQWFNVAFLGLAPSAFNTLIDTLQSAGVVICMVIWLVGVVVLFALRYAGINMTSYKIQNERRPHEDDATVVNSTAREL